LEENLNFMLAAYEALPDKATAQAGLLQIMLSRREEEVRAQIRGMILRVCREACWPLSRLDSELLALDARPVTDLEHYRHSLHVSIKRPASTLA
jgi:hypothetical protein